MLKFASLCIPVADVILVVARWWVWKYVKEPQTFDYQIILDPSCSKTQYFSYMNMRSISYIFKQGVLLALFY